MISDKERQGTVEFLRDEADYWRKYNKNDDTLCMPDSDFVESILEAFGFDGTAVPVYEVFDKLAGLIDRPTCTMAYKPEWSGDELYPTTAYQCSNCGCVVNEGITEYCPSCGYRVSNSETELER